MVRAGFSESLIRELRFENGTSMSKGQRKQTGWCVRNCQQLLLATAETDGKGAEAESAQVGKVQTRERDEALPFKG